MSLRERCGLVPWRGLDNVKRGMTRELTYHSSTLTFSIRRCSH